METTRELIFDEIEQERAYQDKKWGRDFDKRNTINDWSAYISQYLGQGTKINVPIEEWRKQMLKVATLAIAAMELYDEGQGPAMRHYDTIPDMASLDTIEKPSA